MQKGLICLFLLIVAAISVPAYADIAVNSTGYASFANMTAWSGAVTDYTYVDGPYQASNAAENNYRNNNITENDVNVYALAQSWTASISGDLNTIQLGVTGPGASFHVAMYEVTSLEDFKTPTNMGYRGDGTLNVSANMFASNTTLTWGGPGEGNTHALLVLELSGADKIPVTAGHTYVFELTSSTSDISNLMWMRYGGGASTYAGGTMFRAGDSSGYSTTPVNTRGVLNGMSRDAAFAADIIVPPAKASSPTPVDAATGLTVDTTLGWAAGLDAAKHNVYFGTASTPPSVSLNQTARTYDPGTLSYNTTYYWRIDENDVGDTITTGDVWSFTTLALAPPEQAEDPSPADDSNDVNLTPTLSWTAGDRAATHQVYFGTNVTKVTDADITDANVFKGDLTAATYVPGTLDSNTAYYWRVDENNVGGLTAGEVWSLKTKYILPLTIAKCTVSAGKTQGADSTDVNNIKDSITISGTADFPPDANLATQIEVNIISVTDAGNDVVYLETIEDFNGYLNSNGNKINYSYKVPKFHAGAITSLKIDYTKNPKTFSLTASKVDLTGLGGDMRLEFLMSSCTITGDANEAIVNKKKLIPTRLMRMYDDTLLVTKAKATHKTTKALSDTLSVTGEIAIEDINNTNMDEPNLVLRDVNFIWGDQTFSVPDHNFVAAKTGHKYTVKKAVSDVNAGLVSATIDFDKCVFTFSVKDANNLQALPDYTDVTFGINYGIGDANDFSETADVNLVTRRSF
jgi:hypothetical protein